MSSAIEKTLLSEIGELRNDYGALRKTVEVRAKNQDEQAQAIQKLLGGAATEKGFATGSMMSNGEGSHEMSIFDVLRTKRQRTMGARYQDYLKHVYEAENRRGNTEQHEKVLAKSFGSIRANQKASLAEAAGSTGGYLVPTEFYRDLLRFVAEESFVRSRCTTIPMMSRDLMVPALAQSAKPGFGTSGFFGGLQMYWTPELAALQQTQPTFRDITLVARDGTFICLASNQLLQDNMVALDMLLTTLFKEAMAWWTDWYILRGNGAGQPLGVLNAPATYSQIRTTSNLFTLQDAANMLSHAVMSGWANSVWVMNQQVIQQLVTMADSTNGRLVWLNQFPQGAAQQGGGAAQTLPLTFFGLPIFLTEKLPKLGTTGDVLLADFSKQLVGDRLQLQIEASPWPYFTTNQMVWRVIARWDSQPWIDAPIYLADGSDSYQVSPFVVLNSATS